MEASICRMFEFFFFFFPKADLEIHAVEKTKKQTKK